jgi:peptide deformylase
MILPIVAYGSPVLRKVCDEIDPSYPELEKLLTDMWETQYNSNGVGLAAPQINRAIRLFLVDSEQIFRNKEEDDDDDFPDAPGFKGVFINAHIVETSGTPWSYNEGCLSIPKVREDVTRDEAVTIRFMDEQFVEHTKTFHGITARIILHEYDHIEGKLFVDYLPLLKKKIIQGKLNDISKGKIRVDYRMIQPK